jgi:hypothetical protein
MGPWTRSVSSLVVIATFFCIGSVCVAQTTSQSAGSGAIYSQYESAISPAVPTENDFVSEFTSPSGKQVKVVVKAPITRSTYLVPPITANQSAFDYLNNALYDFSGNPRTETIIQFPKGTYNVQFPVYSNCSSNYVHWQLPSGATDLVIDGQGSTVNFSDFCVGMNLPNVNRVVLKNFTFAWPKIQIGSVATVTAVGGNGTTGYTYDAHFAPIAFGPQPKLLAATSAWDKAANHWDLMNWLNDVSYGDGITVGVPLTCEETSEEQKTLGCTVKNIPSYGVSFTVGESVILRFYDFGTGISIDGTDVTLDNIVFQNLIGSDFFYGSGRGLHVTNVTLTRMSGQPISAGGGGTLVTGAVTGDIAVDHSLFEYQGDDAFDLNTPMVRFVPPASVANYSTPMATVAFDQATPDQLQWPSGYAVATGDTLAILDANLAFQGVATVASATSLASGATQLTLNEKINATLAKNGFVAADLTSAPVARYVFADNTFQYSRSCALVMRTPYGWIHNNQFIGQTIKEVPVSGSLYWGEGLGPQELTISNNLFEDIGHRGDFIPLDIMAEAYNFPNNANEIANPTAPAAPSIMQNINVTGNLFLSDQATAVIDVGSAHNIVFSGNRFELTSSAEPAGDVTNQYPVAVHDASDIYFDNNTFDSTWLSESSCAQSRLLTLISPSPQVSYVTPAACEIKATTTNLIFQP